ncbi:MAG: SusC/RagA family TonB-linked outer membrane protein [Bacteroidales bacterium]
MKKPLLLKQIIYRAKSLFLLLAMLLLETAVFGQERRISGTVSDELTKETLPGATVVIKGTTKGASTDINGKFTLEVGPNDVLLAITFVGYEPKEVSIGSQNNYSIFLTSSKVMLSELVVIGYGTVRKSDLTGAVGSVKAKELTKVTSLSPEQSLQGKVAGVQVTSTSGAPGATPSVRIRGVGTFNNSSPIYVVDGVILDNISFLNTADIASMEILKDASATAMYGSRGANGVILITTKSGTIGEEKTNFSYSGEYSIQNLAKKIDLLSGRDFATIANEIPGDPSYNNVDAVPNTDWQDLVFNPAPINNHQLSAWGSTKKTQYYIGIGYFNQKGIVDKSSYERITLKFNNTYNLTNHVKFGNNITIAPYKQQNAPGVTFQVYRAWPTLEPYRADGSFAGVPGVGNPLASIEYNNSFNKGLRAVGNLFLEATFLNGFTARSSFGIDAGYNKAESFTPVYQVMYSDGTASMQANTVNRLFKGTSENLTWLWENTLNYSKQIEKHNINAVVGYTMQNSSSELLNINGVNIIRDAEDFWYLKYGYITTSVLNKDDFVNGVDPYLNYSMLSYLFRANYTFNEKYILTATFRRDGSSKFALENRYSNFPSLAAGWNISKEAFMKDFTKVNKLKVRASWGKIGNEKIAYSNRFSLTQNLMAVFGQGDLQYPGVSYAKSGNPDLVWETTTQTDIGLEVGMLNDRLTGEFDYYHRFTDDILVDLSTPGFLGNGQGQKITYNAGQVLNSGFEANINWRDKTGELGYSVGVLASTIKNEVKSIGGNSGIDSLLFGGDNFYGNVTQSREGLPIGSFWGYKTDGIFQSQDELDAYPHTSDAKIGDLRRVDVNGDSIINGSDRTEIGSPIPKVIFGLNVELTYHNFDFSFNLQGQAGNKIFNGKEAIRPDAYNFEQHVMDRWTGPGTSNVEPRATFGGYNYIPSDKFIQDGSFVRLRSLVVGYTLSEALSKKMHVQQCRLYVKGNNLYTMTKFTGYTPEIGSDNVLSNGIDTGIYPITAVYSFGINLTF